MPVIYTLCDPRDLEIRYVGVTVRTLKQRLTGHISDAKRGRESCHRNNWIKGILAAGLVPLIAELEVVPHDATWQDRERFWIREYRLKGYNLCNLTDGGEGAKGFIRSPETRAKLSAASKGRRQGAETRAKRSAAMKGKKVSAETLEKIRRTKLSWSAERAQEYRERVRASRLGKAHSPQTREKLSRALKGRNLGGALSAETKAKMGLAQKGKQRSPEVKAKLSKLAKERMLDPQLRAKIAATLTGRKVPDDVARRISATLTGRKLSPETIAKIRESALRRKTEKKPDR